MSKNWHQQFLLHPITANLSGDLLYFFRSPYTTGGSDDVVISWDNFAAQFNLSGTDLPLWNANTNSPPLTNSTPGAKGNLYLVSVAGGTTLDGVSSWAVGNYAFFTGGAWTIISEPSQIVYVAKNGSDIYGDGSFGRPFLTLAHALNVTTGTSSAPVKISMSPGTYTETTIVLKPWIYIDGSNSSISVTNPITADASFVPSGGITRFENFTGSTFTGGFNLDFTGASTSIVYLENITVNNAITMTLTGDPGNGAVLFIENIINFGGNEPVYVIANCYGAIAQGATGNVTLTNCPNFTLEQVTVIGDLVTQATSTDNAATVLRDIAVTGTTTLRSTSSGTLSVTALSNLYFSTVTLDGVNVQFSTDEMSQLPLLINSAIASQITYRNISDTLNANYTPVNYTPTNTSVKGNLQGIDNKLGTQSGADVTPYVVGLTLADAPYTSIQAAVTAAASVATSINRKIVYIQAGQYTENVTLAPHVDICGLMSSFINDSYPVSIVGTLTIPGTVISVFNLENISVYGSSSAAVVISGTLNVTLNFKDCLLTGSGQNGLTSTNANAVIVAQDTAIFSNVSPFSIASASISFDQGYINGQSGDCIIAGTSGTAEFSGLNIDSRINVTGTNLILQLQDVQMKSNAASCVNLSGTTNTAILENINLDSTNTNAVTGVVGNVVKYGIISFSNSSIQLDPVLTHIAFHQTLGRVTFDAGLSYLSQFLSGGDVSATWLTGTYEVVGDNLSQTIINKLIGNSDIDSSEITTACPFIDNADASKQWELNLSGKTTATTVTSVYTGGTQTITYPTGNFTVGKAGNVTPYVVGTSLVTAPYTSIDTAITDAHAAFISTGFKQAVYIQPGEYTQNFTPQNGVDIVGLSYGVVFDNTAQIPTCAVKIKGQMILTNTLNINVVGIQIDAPSAITITCSGSNVPVINFSYCILKKTAGTGTSMFFNSNTNLVAGFSNCLLVGITSKRVFDATGGIFRLQNCTQISGTNAPASFTSAQIWIYDSLINDTIELPSSAQAFIYNSSVIAGGNFACVILSAASCTLQTNYSVFTASPGFTNFVIEGAAGASVQIDNATYIDLQQIDPNLTVFSNAKSPSGNASVITAAGDQTLTPQFSIIAMNKTVPAVTTVNLPAVGFAVGQSYTIVDQGRNSATFNITLAPASGNIQGAGTFVMNINGQSVTIMDFGNEYTIV